MWARALGRLAGVHVPLVGMHHAYVVTERIEGIQVSPVRLQMGSSALEGSGGSCPPPARGRVRWGRHHPLAPLDLGDPPIIFLPSTGACAAGSSSAPGEVHTQQLLLLHDYQTTFNTVVFNI